MVTLKPSPWLYRNTHIKFIKKETIVKTYIKSQSNKEEIFT